jgi:hypothetical protein
MDNREPAPPAAANENPCWWPDCGCHGPGPWCMPHPPADTTAPPTAASGLVERLEKMAGRLDEHLTRPEPGTILYHGMTYWIADAADDLREAAAALRDAAPQAGDLEQVRRERDYLAGLVEAHEAQQAAAPQAGESREPDGWITEWRYRKIPGSWREPTFYPSLEQAEAVVNRRAKRDGPSGYYPMRIRPVYFGAPSGGAEQEGSDGV